MAVKETERKNTKWWENMCGYQVYPLSFDTAGGGYGTLRGITDRLDYIKSLGVDSLWLSPFFDSPLKKGLGYNVRDYKKVQETFGTMEDCEALIKKAHASGLKVIFDLVFNHTSDEHEWFKASSDPTHPEYEKYKDFYVWADAGGHDSDGNPLPPNNWITITPSVANAKESAWKWSENRQQFYLHNFADNMPDLNFRDPELPNGLNVPLMEELKSIETFWLDKGVDGFRLDAIPYYAHGDISESCDPHSLAFAERHEHVCGQPLTVKALKELKSVETQYPEKDILFLGEGFIQPPPPGVEMQKNLPYGSAYAAQLVKDEALNQIYMGALEGYKGCWKDGGLLKEIKATLGAFKDIGYHHINWAMENHDMMRAVKRHGIAEMGQQAAARMLGMLTLSLPGSCFIYQGQELGLPAADMEQAKRKTEAVKHDPLDLAQMLYPHEENRIPIVWDKTQPDNGWLHVPAAHRKLAVNTQEKKDASALNFFRKMIDERKTHPALIQGDITFLENLPPGMIAFTREFMGKDRHSSEKMLCIFNSNSRTASLPYKIGEDTRYVQAPAYGYAIRDISQGVGRPLMEDVSGPIK